MCKFSQSANLSTRFFEECIQPSLHHLSALQRRSPETHSKPHSLSKHQFCIWDGFIEKAGFELVLKAEQIQIVKEVEFRKEYYRWNDDHGQSAEMQNKGCLDDSEGLQGILILFKRHSGRGLFHLLGTSAFLNAWGHFLVLTLQSLKISQRANTSFTLNSNGIKKHVPDPQRPHFQKSHRPQTSPPNTLPNFTRNTPGHRDLMRFALHFNSEAVV